MLKTSRTGLALHPDGDEGHSVFRADLPGLKGATSTFDPIPVGTSAAQIYGALAVSVRAAGRDPRPRRFDLLIASVAVSLDLPLVTRNESDFSGIHPALQLLSVP